MVLAKSKTADPKAPATLKESRERGLFRAVSAEPQGAETTGAGVREDSGPAVKAPAGKAAPDALYTAGGGARHGHEFRADGTPMPAPAKMRPPPPPRDERSRVASPKRGPAAAAPARKPPPPARPATAARPAAAAVPIGASLPAEPKPQQPPKRQKTFVESRAVADYGAGAYGSGSSGSGGATIPVTGSGPPMRGTVAAESMTTPPMRPKATATSPPPMPSPMSSHSDSPTPRVGAKVRAEEAAAREAQRTQERSRSGSAKGGRGGSRFPPGACYTCGSLDHYARDCPKGKGGKKG